MAYDIEKERRSWDKPKTPEGPTEQAPALTWEKTGIPGEWMCLNQLPKGDYFTIYGYNCRCVLHGPTKYFPDHQKEVGVNYSNVIMADATAAKIYAQKLVNDWYVAQQPKKRVVLTWTKGKDPYDGENNTYWISSAFLGDCRVDIRQILSQDTIKYYPSVGIWMPHGKRLDGVVCETPEEAMACAQEYADRLYAEQFGEGHVDEITEEAWEKAGQ